MSLTGAMEGHPVCIIVSMTSDDGGGRLYRTDYEVGLGLEDCWQSFSIVESPSRIRRLWPLSLRYLTLGDSEFDRMFAIRCAMPKEIIRRFDRSRRGALVEFTEWTDSDWQIVRGHALKSRALIERSATNVIERTRSLLELVEIITKR